MTKRILVAYDGSEYSEKAVQFALEFAERYKSELYIIHVISLPEPFFDIETETYVEQAKKYARSQHKHLKKEIQHDSLPIHTKIVVGHVVEQLLQHAEKLNVDHIVVGSHGKGLLEGILLGSVSKQLVTYAKCNVTVVR